MFKPALISIVSILLLSSFQFIPTNSSSWEKIQSVEGVDIYQKQVEVETSEYHHSYIVFRYVNTTNKAAYLKWKLNIWYNDNCRSCDLKSPNEYEMSLALHPGETIEGTSQDKDKKLRLFHSDRNNSATQQLSKVEFKIRSGL
ncbi:MAG: hypothetical protein R6T91_04990 [Bacteroidales bacterium]